MLIVQFGKQYIKWIQPSMLQDKRPVFLIAALILPSWLLTAAVLIFSRPSLYIDETYWLVSTDGWFPWLALRYLLSFAYLAILLSLIFILKNTMQRHPPPGRTRYAYLIAAMAIISFLANLGSDISESRMTIANRRFTALVDISVMIVFLALQLTVMLTRVKANKDANRQ